MLTHSCFLLTLKKTPSYAGGNKKLIVLDKGTKIPPKHGKIFLSLTA